MRKAIVVLGILILTLSACATAGEPGAQPTLEDKMSPVETIDPNETVSSGQRDQRIGSGEGILSPMEPLPNESEMARGNAFIDESSITILESFPVQIMLNLKGSLPTPCHQLRVQMSEPDEKGRIDVEVYSLVNPEEVCVQMIQPFQESVNLGSFPSGKYSLYVNDELVGDFTA